jgi:hypothetical protein
MTPFNLIGNDAAVRGDTIRLLVTVVRNGAALNITGSTFTFVAKRWLSDDIPVISKDDTAFTTLSAVGGTTIVTLDPEDTEAFVDDTELNCDVRMTEPSGVITTVARGILEVKLN